MRYKVNRVSNRLSIFINVRGNPFHPSIYISYNDVLMCVLVIIIMYVSCVVLPFNLNVFNKILHTFLRFFAFLYALDCSLKMLIVLANG